MTVSCKGLSLSDRMPPHAITPLICPVGMPGFCAPEAKTSLKMLKMQQATPRSHHSCGPSNDCCHIQGIVGCGEGWDQEEGQLSSPWSQLCFLRFTSVAF